jgi:hypothetical protein
MRCLGLLLATAGAAAAGPRVDLNPDTDRGDVRSPGRENWNVPDGPSASATFGNVTVTLRAPGGKLATAFWKAGYDYPARDASDGVVSAGPVEMTIAGLTPGRHSLATFHNAVGDAPAGKLSVSVDGQVKLAGLSPTRRVLDDADAAGGYVEFEAIADKPVVVTFTPEMSDRSVVLSGFEIDTPNPARRAAKETPADGDEHVAEGAVFRWRPAAGATGHRVYLGTDPAALTLRGTVTGPEFSTAGLKLTSGCDYFWRLDEVHADGVTPGFVQRFRVRHLAFPGAEGYGRFAAGGRGGRVIEVTTLADDGPGSLREAVEAEGPRTVVFRVGGEIRLKSKLTAKNPYLTVAGQTAPGDGICVRGYTFGCYGSRDCIIRHVRIRVGDESGETNDGSGAGGCDHTIYDHCSISWSIDEGFSSRGGQNITVQRCLIAEALNLSVHKKYVGTGKGHSYAGSISGDVGSFHHNLLAHCAGRNWSLAGGLDRGGKRLAGRLDLRNNVIYNWKDRTTDGGVLELNYVNNLYLPGPASRVFTLLKPDPGDPDRGMRAYMAGNVIDGKVGPDDNWRVAVVPAADLPKVRSDVPLYESHVTTQSAREAYDGVLADVGATRPRPDAVDRRVIADVRNRSVTFTGSKGKLPGIIDTQADSGGWPEYKGGEPAADADHDGMPDAWERAHGLNPADPADRNGDSDGDGYTNLEDYLNAQAAGKVL